MTSGGPTSKPPGYVKRVLFALLLARQLNRHRPPAWARPPRHSRELGHDECLERTKQGNLAGRRLTLRGTVKLAPAGSIALARLTREWPPEARHDLMTAVWLTEGPEANGALAVHLGNCSLGSLDLTASTRVREEATHYGGLKRPVRGYVDPQADWKSAELPLQIYVHAPPAET